MTLVAAALLALAAAGLFAVRTATPLARYAAWLVCLACAVVALMLPQATWREQPARVAAANLRTEPAASATALLGAASAASPRADALHVYWREPLPTPPQGALGARVAVPPALPFAPQDLALQQLGPAERDRPLLLRLLPVAGATDLPAELCIRRGETVVQRTPCTVGPRAVDVAFTPGLAGEYTLDLAIAAGPTNATARGVLAVAEPRAVLVVEPSGLCAEALRTQGLAVVAADAVPDDLSPFAAVVVGAPLPANAEGALAIAARDGLGVFAFAPGLGAEGGPLRGLLPVRPVPVAAPTPGEGGGGERAPGPPSTEPPPVDVPPPAEPPPPPPADQPPVGDTQGRGQLSDQPIEVDKRAIALALVVDRSASMGSLLGDGNTKMSYAKTSALRTAQALTAGDRVGIVTFGNKGEGRIELPMTDAADANAVRAGIERLRHAQEYTYLLGGLRVAVDALRPVQAAVKHVVVVSDGEFDYNEELALRALARRARQQDRITVSVITIADATIGPSFTRAAEGLAADGGGEFFTVARPDSVPAFVSAEVTRSLSRVGRTPRRGDGAQMQPPPNNPLPQPPAPPPPTPPPPKPPTPAPTPPPAPLPTRIAVVAVAESPLLAPEPQPTWPALGAVVANRATADATTLLAARDPLGSAVLAYGNRGLGRVGCFAAELFGPAGDAFRAEPAFPARLAQWVTAVLPAQQLAAPQSLLFAVELSPVVPTPAEAQALVALGGAPTVDPQELALQRDPTEIVHGHAPQVPAAAGWLLLGFVALAALERWTATRALRRGRA